MNNHLNVCHHHHHHSIKQTNMALDPNQVLREMNRSVDNTIKNLDFKLDIINKRILLLCRNHIVLSAGRKGMRVSCPDKEKLEKMLAVSITRSKSIRNELQRLYTMKESILSQRLTCMKTLAEGRSLWNDIKTDDILGISCCSSK